MARHARGRRSADTAAAAAVATAAAAAAVATAAAAAVATASVATAASPVVNTLEDCPLGELRRAAPALRRERRLPFVPPPAVRKGLTGTAAKVVHPRSA